MSTDYTIRDRTDAGLLRTRFTVCDAHGQIVHVTIRDRALHDGHGDRLIRDAIRRAQHRVKALP